MQFLVFDFGVYPECPNNCGSCLVSGSAGSPAAGSPASMCITVDASERSVCLSVLSSAPAAAPASLAACNRHWVSMRVDGEFCVSGSRDRGGSRGQKHCPTAGPETRFRTTECKWETRAERREHRRPAVQCDGLGRVLKGGRGTHRGKQREFGLQFAEPPQALAPHPRSACQTLEHPTELRVMTPRLTSN
eukprot:1294463-Rhodomonas_salina.1